MKHLLIAAALAALLASPVAAQEADVPTVRIDYKGQVIEVPEDEPLVTCVVAQYADLNERSVTIVTWIRNLDGEYDLVAEKTTRQTGPLANQMILDCLFLERTGGE